MFRLIERAAKPPRRRASDYEVGSVRKAMEILCSFTAETPIWALSEISRKLKIPKSTALNLLRTLERFGLITKDPHAKRYQLGPRVFQLSPLLSQNAQLAAKAAPHLRCLAEETGETVKLGVHCNGQVLILAAIESRFMLHTRGDQGRLAPLHCTGVGKALLASLNASELAKTLGRQSLQRFTARTITQRSRLEQELVKIRQVGYAVDSEEHEAGVCCIGATVPVPDGWPPVAISISGPSSRIKQNTITKLAPGAIGACRAISNSLFAPASEYPKGQAKAVARNSA